MGKAAYNRNHAKTVAAHFIELESNRWRDFVVMGFNMKRCLMMMLLVLLSACGENQPKSVDFFTE